MVQAIISFGEREDRILNIVKGKFGFKNKSDAVNFVLEKFEETFLEPELKPEFVKRIKKIESSGQFKTYKNIDELRKDLKNV